MALQMIIKNDFLKMRGELGVSLMTVIKDQRNNVFLSYIDN
jgi:hypothetical protein